MLKRPVAAFLLAAAAFCAPAGANIGTITPAPRDVAPWDADELKTLLDSLSNDPDVRIMVGETELHQLDTLTDLRSKRKRPSFTAKANAFRASLDMQLSRTALLSGSHRDWNKTVIYQTSLQHGLDPGYMTALAWRESGLKATAMAKTSSATGLFQFTSNTWLCTLSIAGPQYGVTGTEAIIRGKDGRCRVDNPLTRIELLTLRFDPQTNANMAAFITKSAWQKYVANFHRYPSSADLYTFHFFGEDEAPRFLRAVELDPWAPAAKYEPVAANANRPLFYDRYGRAKSVQEIYASFAIY